MRKNALALMFLTSLFFGCSVARPFPAEIKTCDKYELHRGRYVIGCDFIDTRCFILHSSFGRAIGISCFPKQGK